MEELNLEPGHWSHSFLMSDVDVAYEWGGMSPSQFRALSDQDKAEMSTYLDQKRKMTAYEIQEQRREAEQEEALRGK